MKKVFVIIIFSVCYSSLNAALFHNLPYTITQPDGEVIKCFVSGDEYYNWIHDKNGYTIIQSPDGYYYYAAKEYGKIIPSSYKVNTVNPLTIGFEKWTKISNPEYQKRAEKRRAGSLKSAGPQKAPHTDTLNNIVIYIRFSDDTEFELTRQGYDSKFNPTTGISLKAYYKEVSYNNLTISSTHYPLCATPATSNNSYRDSHLRGYFKKYNATQNPLGYQTEEESTEREQQLLVDAVTWINANSPVNPGINIDADDDGYIDNVCFIIRGESEGWSDLLWAHSSALYTQEVNINTKRVFEFTFQPENQVDVYTLCHEMFHALGAPDLYHYYDDIFSPVGSWDVMESGFTHMGAYMKWKYSDSQWITSIPEITVSGTYTLHPLTSSTNNCYKIASPNSLNEFFIMEYRKQSGNFESNIPGNGLLVYRINTDFTGNAGFDNISIFDEVYIYRPDGTSQENGNVDLANFSSNVGRTAINDITNPKSYLTNDLPGGLDISNITSAGTTISFNVYISDVEMPSNFLANGVSESQIDLSWNRNTDNNEVLIAVSTENIIGSPTKGINYSIGSQIPGGGTVIYSGNANSYSHMGLTDGTNYFYRIWSKSGSSEYSPGTAIIGSTVCMVPDIPIEHGFNGSEISPCWTVETVATGDEREEPASITQVKSGIAPDAVPFEGTHMIKFNSTYCGAGNVMRLSSPSFSTIGRSELYVNFAWHRDTQWPEYVDYMTIQWSTNGVTWNDGDTYERYFTISDWIQRSYKLPAGALGKTNVQIGFLFTSEYGYNCYLDNVSIKPEKTNAVEDISLQKLLVFPNPSDGLFRLIPKIPYNKMNVAVHNIDGRLIYSNDYETTTDNIIDLSTQPKGIYILTIQIEDEILNKKLVIE
jgi:M6 family metalloprotease-like protein